MENTKVTICFITYKCTHIEVRIKSKLITNLSFYLRNYKTHTQSNKKNAFLLRIFSLDLFFGKNRGKQIHKHTHKIIRRKIQKKIVLKKL